MEEYLQFVTVDTWTMIFTWANLVILFLLLKKFLFRPVNKVLDERRAEIEKGFLEAENASARAEQIKAQYEMKLSAAKDEADVIIKDEVETDSIRSESILREASEEAAHIIEKSQKQIERDKKNAVNEARSEIAAMAVLAAQQLIGRNIDAEDDERLITDIIDRI